VEIAGVRSEDVQGSVDGQTLHIRGVRRAPETSDVRRLHQMEIATGPFERRVSIPIAFERDRVSAHLSEGFLTVTLPRRMPVRRRVELES
jgi:HSP20 family protein